MTKKIDSIFEYSYNEIISYKIKTKHGRDLNDISCIYCIEDIVTGCLYIGRTQGFFRRMRCHIQKSKHIIEKPYQGDTLIARAMHKRCHCFKFHILTTYEEIGYNFFNRKIATEKEVEYMVKYNTLNPNGYNFKYK